MNHNLTTDLAVKTHYTGKMSKVAKAWQDTSVVPWGPFLSAGVGYLDALANYVDFEEQDALSRVESVLTRLFSAVQEPLHLVYIAAHFMESIARYTLLERGLGHSSELQYQYTTLLMINMMPDKSNPEMEMRRSLLQKALTEITGGTLVSTNPTHQEATDVASDLFGQTWLALFADSLEDAHQLVKNILHVRPPFVGTRMLTYQAGLKAPPPEEQCEVPQNLSH